jgi:DNA polymerase
VYCEFASKVFDREITKADTVERFIGKTAVLGLGYGMGPEKFQATLKQSAERIEIDFDKALSVVRQYRSDFAYIPKLWVALENLLRQSRTMRTGDGFGISHKCVQAAHNAIQLPNGMALKYPCLQMTPEGLAYKSMNKLVKTYGGRITENVVQALARIIICDQMLAIQALDGFDVVLTVHDEIIAVADQSNPEEKLQTMIDVMRTPPAWASELPLEAEGGWDVGYSK